MPLLTIHEAEAMILADLPVLPAEDCSILNAHGRVLRKSVQADRDQPPFDRVTMDGYALKFASWEAGNRRFKIEGNPQAAGTIQRSLESENGCVEIMTGSLLPLGTDAVVPYEETKAADGLMSVSPELVLKHGNAVHWQGSDFPKDAMMLSPGVRLSGREIAVAASVGASSLTVSTLPSIAVVATGDELVDVDAHVSPHHVRRSNDYAMRAALIAAGYPRVERFHLRDMKYELETQMKRLIVEFDVVLLSGGVSKGKFDFLPTVLTELGVQKKFHGVRQRPGKPFWFGITPRRTPVFALPGNPVSSYTCLRRYVLPALAQMSGLAPEKPDYVALASAISFKPDLAYLMPVRVDTQADGKRLARPDPTNTSGDFAGLVGTDGFVELPWEQSEFPAGYVARFWPWS